MRICIDARMYGLKHAGIGRYVENLIKGILENGPKFNLFLLIRQDDEQKIIEDLKVYSVKPVLITADARHYSIKEQILIPYILYKNKFDLVHFPHFNVPIFYFGKFLVTIHDLLWHETRGGEVTTLSGLVYFIKYIGYRLVFANSVKRALKILTPSVWVKNKLINTYELNNNNVSVIYEGIEKTYVDTRNLRLEARNVFKKFKIRSPYVIYTGSVYPHKNLKILLEAVIQINMVNKKKLNLYIVSSRNVFTAKLTKMIQELNGEAYIKLLGFVPDRELRGLYRKAVAFVFPSLSEGFGLPGLEAMAAKCPVIASNSSVLPEVYQNSALYFNPNAKIDLAGKILSLMNNEKIREDLVEKSSVLVKKYDWKITANQTVKIYENCIGL